MKIRVSTLDDLLHEVFERVMRSGHHGDPSKGEVLEVLGAVIELKNPRARLSSSEERHILFSCFGELLWYLSGSDSFAFIRYYLPYYRHDDKDAESVREAYGPRLRNPEKDQLLWVIELLKQKPYSRRAVIPIYSREDTYSALSEFPCTCTLQFFVRRNRLEMVTHMRSNDAYLGLPGDVFAFTMIQELLARALGIEVGTYRHMVGSLHLYVKDMQEAKSFLNEGWYRKAPMPPMPLGDPFRDLAEVLRLERAIRLGNDVKPTRTLPEYWQDLVQLLRIYKSHREKESSRRIGNLRKGIRSKVYQPYIDTKQQLAERREQARRNNLRKSGLLFVQDDGVENES